MRLTVIIIILLALTLVPARAQAALPDNPTNRLADTRGLYEKEQAAYAGNTNVLVRPGMRADRAAREVALRTEATGITGHDVIEFFLIAPHSGNDYEALLTSRATAGDIDRALRFIGLTPGRGVDYARNRFWPKGERVRVWARLPDASDALIPIESLLLNERTGRPLSPDGLVYVQAPTNRLAATDTPDRHPVDVDSRGSIAANYNESYTVFDVPRAAPQSEVYTSQTVNPDYVLDAGRRIELILKPELPPGERRVQDLTLTVQADGTATQSLATLTFALTNHTARTALPHTDLNGLLEHLMALCETGKDPFVALDVEDDVQIAALKALCLVLASIETDRGIRIEPPQHADHLYYKAYMPDNALRNRETRIMQPAELTFTAEADGTIGVSLRDITEHWHGDRIKPTLTFKTHAIDSPAALRARLTPIEDDLPILLVFVPETLGHAQLMHWMVPLLATHPTVHVFTPVAHPSAHLRRQE